MNKYFYSHIVETESIAIELDGLDLSKEEKKHLALLVDSNVHNTILNVVLSSLSESDKKAFFEKLKDDRHDETWEFLKTKIEDIEEKIKDISSDIKEQLRKDIKEARNKKEEASAH